MGRKKKPVLRLTLFFIAVVIASGSILAYLSINNISNLKELTEKRVEEEQENLALAVSEQIKLTINDLLEKFPDYPGGKHPASVNWLKTEDTNGLVKQQFLIDREGDFLWPWFVNAYENLPGDVPSKSYQSNFEQAERAEFNEQNFSKAGQYYLASLRESSNNTDSVQALNALARLSVKSEEWTQALSYYSSIISAYGALLNSYGFPYVYYAIPQLIRISNSSNRDQIMQEIDSCLTGMASGKIPLNHSTRDMLQLVSDWIAIEPAPIEKITLINKSIQAIESSLEFIERNEEQILEYLKKDDRDDFPLVKGSYHALNSTQQDAGELLLVKLDSEYASGFSVDFEKLWHHIMEQPLTEVTEFDFELEIVLLGNGINVSELPLTTTKEISPYFMGYNLLVKLKNASVINELVRRRSWIYGIALTLLIGGMILGILLIHRDILREEHLAQLRADFISNVTHELKTPLTSIQLFTESILLNRIKSAAHKKEYLQIILKETESLKRMINNILDFSKEEKGKLNFNFKEVNVTALVNEAVQDLEYWLVEKKFALVKEIDEGVTASVDPGALKQAIINLLNNAIKFSRNRKEILVSLKKEGEMILIQVEDKGIGIPEDQKELIFQP
ncbi:MAG: hypothetical protein DRI97_13690, partial [Bacteroidetes bacterium]